MTTETKDIYDALLAGNKSLDSGFRLIIAAKYMAEDPAVRLEIIHILQDLVTVEENLISLMLRLNNEI